MAELSRDFLLKVEDQTGAISHRCRCPSNHPPLCNVHHLHPQLIPTTHTQAGPLLAPITAPYKQKVFPPCVDKGGRRVAKTHLHENTAAPCRFLYSLHSTGINSSGAAPPPILNCNNPRWAYKGQWRRVYMVVGGAESSKSEFGTTALSFKTNPQSGLHLASELPISKGINFQQI